MKTLKLKVLSVAICLVLTLGIELAIRGFPYFVNLVEDFRGYDYESKIAKQYGWIGPKPGEILDPNYLVNTNGTTLYQLPKNELILLTVVDPGTGACKQTREQMLFLDENLQGKGVDRFIVCFSQKVSPSDLSEYVKSINLNTSSLSWTNGLESILPSIKAIVFPSHILIDSDGIVIKSFPGTSNEKLVRDRMAREVLRQVMVEKNRRSPHFY